jgi:hypothetical protein
MSNYIHTLEDEKAALKAEVESLKGGMGHFQAYLMSEKYYTDPTIGVREVERRLRNIMTTAWEANIDQQNRSFQERQTKKEENEHE